MRNYLNSIINRLSASYCAWRDVRTDRKILVIESDDWGSIRISSRQVWEELQAMGYAVDKRPYERFDILESDKDVEALVDVLLSYKDMHGHHPVITMNYLSANPDFEAIRGNGFTDYVSESISATYGRYPNSGQVMDLVRQGMKEGILMPQSHGREHLNVCQWMEALRRGDEDVMTAFKRNMCGISPKGDATRGNSFVVALRSDNDAEQKYAIRAVESALKEFEEIWNMPSVTFVAPNYTWNEQTESVLHAHGVCMIQTSRRQRLSHSAASIYHYSGQHSSCGLVYSIRNCQFEPSTCRHPEKEVNNCLAQVSRAFKEKKIAVISSHRINYVGGLDESNRTDNLQRLSLLLSSVLELHPEVEFMSSADVARIITGK